MNGSFNAALAYRGFNILAQEDPSLYTLLEQEYLRQTQVLTMVAASSVADPSVMACEGTVLTNVTTEGYPGARFHAGCEVIDVIEEMAINRAKYAFGAKYANVQPHSGTTANEIVMFSLLQPGDTMLGLELCAGGHLTHGSQVSVSGQCFHAIGYDVNEQGFIDYAQVSDLAHRYKPKLIICGASAYPRFIDFEQFRAIADEVGAFLLADISHIAGLVAAGEHPSPINHAHFTTTSTYKQLYGPRGGLILMGKDYAQLAPNGKQTLSDMIQRAVFPFFQGTPHIHSIAAKARALARVTTPGFTALAQRITANAACLAQCLTEKGYTLLTGGTDNHIVLINVLEQGLTGVIAERALETCNIIVNKNRIPRDKKKASVGSGIRIGTNSIALRGMTEPEIRHIADLIHCVLSKVQVSASDVAYVLDSTVQEAVRKEVQQLCMNFPILNYALASMDV